MPTQVHLNIDDKLMDEIRALAAQERRTITQQFNILIEGGLAARSAAIKAIDAIEARTVLKSLQAKAKAGKA